MSWSAVFDACKFLGSIKHKQVQKDYHSFVSNLLLSISSLLSSIPDIPTIVLHINMAINGCNTLAILYSSDPIACDKYLKASSQFLDIIVILCKDSSICIPRTNNVLDSIEIKPNERQKELYNCYYGEMFQDIKPLQDERNKIIYPFFTSTDYSPNDTE